MNNPDTEPRNARFGFRTPARGWKWAAHLLPAVLACGFAGAGQAQDDYADLDDAVTKLTRLLVLEGSLGGKEVFVSSRDFFELGSERSLPLSGFLARKLIRALRRQGAIPVTATDDEHEAAILRGEWDIDPRSGNLHLFLEVKRLTDDGSLRSLASEEGRVPVTSISERYLEPDLESHGRFIVRQLEKDLPLSGRYRLYVHPFRIADRTLPGGFGEELLDIWLSAFTGSRRFTLVGSPGQAEGELRVTVRDRGEFVQVSLRVRSNQGHVTAAVTVRLDKKDFPPGMVMPPPDILHRVAQAGDIGGLRAALESGADVDARDGEGWTALMHAAARGYPLLVRTLLEADAAPDHQAPDGATALFMAAAEGHTEIIERLMEAGADVSIRGSKGRTAAEVAREKYGDAETARRNGEPPAVLALLEGMSLDDAAFAHAKGEGTVAALDGYLSLCKLCGHAEQAQRLKAEAERKRADDEAFARAKRLHTESGYREYLARRGGRHEAEARALLSEVTKPRWDVGEVFRDCPGCPEMVVVPEGSFMMGSPASNEGPVHRVTMARPFAVGVYEVTFGEWDACVSGGGCGGYRPDDAGWGRGRRPVIGLSGRDAQGYVAWLSGETGEAYRLLSEAEWEYVARAGTTGAYHFGSSLSPSQANHAESGHGKTVPVGSYPANAFGLHDVHGNVWEWVEDCWNDSYRGAPSDGSAWESGDCSRRVLRGGSWNLQPGRLRSAHRFGIHTGIRFLKAGFRVARTLTP